MKFSIVSTILLAQGMAAMPWSNSKVKSGGEITQVPQLIDHYPSLTTTTLHIQVSQGSSGNNDQTTIPEHNGHIDPGTFDICLRVCWPKEPTCPDGWAKDVVWVSMEHIIAVRILLNGYSDDPLGTARVPHIHKRWSRPEDGDDGICIT
ncbi:unnamed protein product [Fusarium equiseti]|uniref:Uncharacterized protein n=1 Tax=Fusarium equiseti TaxID=61235 RepID=A0A8J2J2H0_FUSEQ|nr:unnamed protein product [Fusarium equiseti]